MVYPPLNAQIGPSPNATNTPNYGIYGSAPTPGATAFPCGTPRSARLEDYPEFEGGLSYTLPLNGSKNFNFFYTSDGNGFLSGGGYKITYLNASGASCYGSSDIVTYSPNTGHTNGVQVRPFAGSPNYPVGIYGIAHYRIPGGGGATQPIANAIATVGHSQIYPHKAKTNAIGYFSIYYSTAGSDGFATYDVHYDLRISGLVNGCTFTYFNENYAIWTPATDPTLASYYQSSFDSGTVVLESSQSGCGP